MKNEFDDYAKRIIRHFENEGYKINSTLFTTVRLHDSYDKTINAYMEPYAAELSKNNVQVRVEFNLIHERVAKKKKIKSITIKPESRQLENILKSKEHREEIFLGLL